MLTKVNILIHVFGRGWRGQLLRKTLVYLYINLRIILIIIIYAPEPLQTNKVKDKDQSQSANLGHYLKKEKICSFSMTQKQQNLGLT